MLDIDLTDRQRDVLTNLGLTLFSLLIITAGMEGLLRAGVVQPAPYPDQYRFCEGPAERGQFHPKYGWTEEPNSQFLEKSSLLDDWSRFSHDENGFRDTYDSGERSVVLLGDSYTHGSLVDDRSTFSYLVDSTHPDTSVENYGIGGYGTGNELAVYRNVSDEHDHDVVVLAYFVGNDMINNVDDRTNRPKYELRDGEAVLVREPEPLSNSSDDENDHGVVGRVHDRLQVEVATYNFVYSRMRPMLAAAGIDEAPPTFPPPREKWDDQLAITRGLLEEVSEEARKNDAELLVVAIPSRGEVDPNNPAYADQAAANDYFGVQRRMLRSFAEENGNAELLDLKPALREEASPGDPVYGTVDAHLNERGHAVAARAINRRLVEAGHLEDRGGIETANAGDANLGTCG